MKKREIIELLEYRKYQLEIIYEIKNSYQYIDNLDYKLFKEKELNEYKEKIKYIK